MTVAVFAGFQSLIILNTGEIPEFCKTFNDFREIPSKFTKFWEIHGIPVKLTKHFLQDFQFRPWVCGYFLE